jgi:hypothetical protein
MHIVINFQRSSHSLSYNIAVKHHSTTPHLTKPPGQQWEPSIKNLSDRKAHFANQSHPPDHLATKHKVLSSHRILRRQATLLPELALGLPITCWSSLGTERCLQFSQQSTGGGSKLFWSYLMKEEMRQTSSFWLLTRLSFSLSRVKIDLTVVLIIIGYSNLDTSIIGFFS